MLGLFASVAKAVNDNLDLIEQSDLSEMNKVRLTADVFIELAAAVTQPVQDHRLLAIEQLQAMHDLRHAIEQSIILHCTRCGGTQVVMGRDAHPVGLGEREVLEEIPCPVCTKEK